MSAGQTIELGGADPAQLRVGYDVEVDPHTGQPSIAVPLPLTAGRGDATPQLSLAYAPGDGASVFGFGWTLGGVPAISVDTRRHLPFYDDRDSYVLPDGRELVPARKQVDGEWRPLVEMRNGYEVRTYRPTGAGGAVRAERWLDPATRISHWRLLDGGDRLTIFGAHDDGSSRVADAERPECAIVWLADVSVDACGNAIAYSYLSENDDGVDLRATCEHRRARRSQRYLKTVRWGNATPMKRAPGSPLPKRWLYRLVLDYGDHATDDPASEPDRPWSARPDPYSRYSAGFEVRTHRLCRRLLTFHHFDELGAAPVLVRSVALEHEQDGDGATLRSLQVTGHRPRSLLGPSTRALPPLRFIYSEPQVDDAFESIEGSASNLPAGLASPHLELVDLQGDGVPGLMSRHDGAWYYQQPDGGGGFGRQVALATLPSTAPVGLSLGDFDRDGHTDAVALQGRAPAYCERDGRGEGDWTAPRSVDAIAHLQTDRQRAQWVDLDADGLADLLVDAEDRFLWYRSLGKRGFEEPREILKPRPDGASAPLLAEDLSLDFFFADMSGDGLPDLVSVRPGRVEYWPNLGRGSFGESVLLDGECDVCPYGEFDPDRVRLVDVTGSGRADILYLGSGELRICLNGGGDRLLPGPTVGGLPHVAHADSLQVLDLHQDGTNCLVWSSALPGAVETVHALRLTRGVVPRMLTAIEDGCGLRTRISYGSSAQHFLRDRDGSEPWATTAPAHSVVVDAIANEDLLAGVSSTRRFAYHDGSWDRERRAPRGFGRVDELDATESAAGAALAVARLRHWYHAGDEQQNRAPGAWVDDPLAAELMSARVEDPDALSLTDLQEAQRALGGRPTRVELWDDADDAAPISVEQSSYRVRCVQPSDGHFPACFEVAAEQQLQATYERVADDPRVEHHLVLAFDEHGEPAVEAAIGYSRRAAVREDPAQGQLIANLVEHTLAYRETAEHLAHAVPVATREFAIAQLADPPPGELFTPAGLGVTLAPALAAPFDHHEAVDGAGPAAVLTTWERTRYWNDKRTAAAPAGEVGVPLLMHHEEAACFTPEFAAGALAGAEPNAAAMQSAGHYALADGYWWKSEPVQVPAGPDGFFLPARIERADGAAMVIERDRRYNLGPVRARDASGAEMTAEHDHIAAAVSRVTDANGTVSEVAFDPLGVAVVQASHGRVLDDAGAPTPYGCDPLAAFTPHEAPTPAQLAAQPGAILQGADSVVVYDLDAFLARGEPVAVASAIRTALLHGAGADDPASSSEVEVAYIDGLGRPLQVKTLVESGPAISRAADGSVLIGADGEPLLAPADPRWHCDGHVSHDAKQQPIERYDPFFTPRFAYEGDEALRRLGLPTLTVYDAVGRPLEVRLADGTVTANAYGAWTTTQWDANDRVNDSSWRLEREALPADDPEKQALLKAQAHADTPIVEAHDPLGRTVAEIAQLPGGGSTRVRTELGPDGERRRVIDQRGIVSHAYRTDLEGRVLEYASADAGVNRTLPDALDRPWRRWDANANAHEKTHDLLDRPLEHRLRAAGSATTKVLSRFAYGGAGAVPGSNLCGRLTEQCDGAGVVRQLALTPDGLPLRAERQFVADHRGEPDWSGAGPSLDSEIHRTRSRYDALGRAVHQDLPDGSTRRSVYQRGGGLAQLGVTPPGRPEAILLRDCSYDAHGQRDGATLGNGVRLRTAYDRHNQCVRRQRALPATGPALCDIAYVHDPVGNVIDVLDSAQEPAGGATPLLQGTTITARRSYTYDALYRLTGATGRVHRALVGEGPSDAPRAHLADGGRLQRFTQSFEYDEAGNLRRLHHQAPTAWTTTFWISPTSNRALPDRDPGGAPVAKPEQRFDTAGQLVSLPHLRSMRWSAAGLLASVVTIERDDGRPDDAEHYQYDGEGMRARKVSEVLVNGELEVTERRYLDGCEIIRVRRAGAPFLERMTSHVDAGPDRVATIHRWTSDSRRRETDDIDAVRTHYHVANARGDAILELDEAGGVIAYEEYLPYGGTAVMAADRDRDVSLRDYRYSGKERDATGLYAFGHRYYAPWMGRWISPDPEGEVDGPNLYQYVLGNPVTLNDPDGHRTRTSGGHNPISKDDALAAMRGRLTPEQIEQVVNGRMRAVQIKGQMLAVTPKEYDKLAAEVRSHGGKVVEYGFGQDAKHPLSHDEDPLRELQDLTEAIALETPSPPSLLSSGDGLESSGAGHSQGGSAGDPSSGARATPGAGKPRGPGGGSKPPGGGRTGAGALPAIVPSLGGSGRIGSGRGAAIAGAGALSAPSALGSGGGPGVGLSGAGFGAGGTGLGSGGGLSGTRHDGAGGGVKTDGHSPEAGGHGTAPGGHGTIPGATGPQPGGTGVDPTTGDRPAALSGAGEAGKDKVSAPGGSADGRPDGSEQGIEDGRRGGNPGPTVANPGDGHAGRGPGGTGASHDPARHTSTALDSATRLAGLLNFTTETDPNGQSGGIPEGHGNTPSRIGQLIYIALAVISAAMLIADIIAAAKAVYALGIRGMLRATGAFFRRSWRGAGEGMLRLGEKIANYSRSKPFTRLRPSQLAARFLANPVGYRGLRNKARDRLVALVSLFSKRVSKAVRTFISEHVDMHHWVIERRHYATDGKIFNRRLANWGEAGWNLFPAPRKWNQKALKNPLWFNLYRGGVLALVGAEGGSLYLGFRWAWGPGTPARPPSHPPAR